MWTDRQTWLSLFAVLRTRQKIGASLVDIIRYHRQLLCSKGKQYKASESIFLCISLHNNHIALLQTSDTTTALRTRLPLPEFYALSITYTNMACIIHSSLVIKWRWTAIRSVGIHCCTNVLLCLLLDKATISARRMLNAMLLKRFFNPLKPELNPHLLFAGIIRSSPFSPR